MRCEAMTHMFTNKNDILAKRFGDFKLWKTVHIVHCCSTFERNVDIVSHKLSHILLMGLDDYCRLNKNEWLASYYGILFICSERFLDIDREIRQQLSEFHSMCWHRWHIITVTAGLQTQCKTLGDSGCELNLHVWGEEWVLRKIVL